MMNELEARVEAECLQALLSLPDNKAQVTVAGRILRAVRKGIDHPSLPDPRQIPLPLPDVP